MDPRGPSPAARAHAMMLSLPLRNMLDGIGERVATCFAVVMPDGSRFPVGKGEPAFTIRFHTEAALFATATRGHIGLMEAYFDQEAGTLDGIENNLHELRYANRNPALAKANARAHYDLGTDFYRPWLDDALMMYTCGYDPDARAPHLFDKCVLKR